MQKMDSFLELNASRYPDKAAVICNGITRTYRGLDRRAATLAKSFMKLGITKGSRVAYLFKNSVEIIEVYFAIQKLGAVAVPLNSRLIWQEIAFLLNSAEACAFIFDSTLMREKDADTDAVKSVNILISTKGNLEGYNNIHSYEELINSGDCDLPQNTSDIDDLSRIQFTGGTSGIPKGVMHTHRQDALSILSYMMQTDITYCDSVVLVHSPFDHHGGFVFSLCTLATGGTLILLDHINVHEIAGIIMKNKVSHLLLMPPTSYLNLEPALKKYDLSSVRVVQSAAGAISDKIIKQIFDYFPNCVINYCWAQTESGVGSMMKFYKNIEYDTELATTVGKESNLMEMRLVDKNGNDVPNGSPGELIVKGGTVMSGYYNQPALSAQTIKDGWLYTGDIFKRDAAGFYYMMGRSKDMIKSGGENVFAAEVEGVINSHPAVAECAVIGVPDGKWGEAVCAVIRLDDESISKEDIINHCKVHMASYKKPKYIIFTEEALADPAGKMKKGKISDKYIDKITS